MPRSQIVCHENHEYEDFPWSPLYDNTTASGSSVKDVPAKWDRFNIHVFCNDSILKA